MGRNTSVSCVYNFSLKPHARLSPDRESRLVDNYPSVMTYLSCSISLGDYFESFVDSKVSEGRFSSASEVIRAGLRLLEEEENKILVLKNAVQEGIESGAAKDFDPEKHLESLKAKNRNG